jgi:hypothetical protein
MVDFVDSFRIGDVTIPRVAGGRCLRQPNEAEKDDVCPFQIFFDS